MKKIISLLLAALLLLPLAGCLAGAENAPLEELLADFSSLLDSREQLYTLQEDLYSALKAFLEENDYPSLLRARLACSRTVQALQGFTVPQMQLTDQAILELMRRGVEIDGLEAEFDSVRDSLSDFLTDARMFEADLYRSVYQTSLTRVMAQRLAASRGLMDCSAAHDRFAVNYLLSPLAQESAVQEFWQALAGRWPIIGAGSEGWIKSQAEIAEKTISNQDMISLENGNFARLAKEFSLYSKRMEAAYQEKDAEAIQADLNVIDALPAAAPQPEGWPGWESAALEIQALDENGLPAYWTRRIKGVSLEAFMAYCRKLEAAGGEEAALEGSDEAGWTASFSFGGSPLLLTWTPDGSASVGCDPRELALTAEWYLEYLP